MVPITVFVFGLCPHFKQLAVRVVGQAAAGRVCLACFVQFDAIYCVSCGKFVQLEILFILGFCLYVLLPQLNYISNRMTGQLTISLKQTLFY